jgi:TonB family protein
MAGNTGKDEIGAMASVAPTSSFDEHDPSRDSARRMALSAVVAAMLLHALVIVMVVMDWGGLFGSLLPQEAPPIPVSLVFETPPPPPPPPAEKPEPVPTPPPLAPRMSGPDEKTAAASENAKVEALPEPKPAAEQPQPRQSGTTVDKDKTPPKPKSEAKPEGQQAMAEPEAKTESPPGPLFHSFRLPSPHGGTAPRDLAGDAYLNAIKARVESHRIYPPASEFHGVREREVTYGIQIDPAGNLVTLTLIASSGSSVIDQAAGQMIRASSPFPHIPPSYPQIRTLITGTIPIYPR